jgi:uncharacterized membrane protein (UPF0127 family)
MRRVSVWNRSSEVLLGGRVDVADSYFTRLRGLLGRPALGDGEGLLIVPSRGVHMFGMKFPLDVLLLDRDGRVEAAFPGLAPGETTGMLKGVRFALELPVGTIGSTDTRLGDIVDWEKA